ncbi:choice-of-anchor A family protein [Salininema proteolyticum]|uniref:Choice-of-anchor A family protein n=1 Tax=Salininema proteolyticum TaxID=1607685 RepID=A0ABV8U3J4_9ACTN
MPKSVLRLLSGTAAVSAGLLLAPSPAAADTLFPEGFGVCTGDRCPDAYPALHDGDEKKGEDDAGSEDETDGEEAWADDSVNVYAGGDFTADGAAAAEGRVVVDGDFTVEGDGVYSVGTAENGSHVGPAPGSDYLVVGGDLTVAEKKRLSAGEGEAAGSVSYGGELEAEEAEKDSAEFVHAPDAAGEFNVDLASIAKCATDAATGTVERDEDGRVVFTGNGYSRVQYFTVDAELSQKEAASLSFERIPADATVVVNHLGDSASFNVAGGDESWEGLRERLMWNIPMATEVAFRGDGEFFGTVLVGNAASTSTVSVPGLSGRFYTAGNLVHKGEDAQFHAYPFEGELPGCGMIPAENTALAEQGHIQLSEEAQERLPKTGASMPVWIAGGIGAALVGGMALFFFNRALRQDS